LAFLEKQIVCHCSFMRLRENIMRMSLKNCLFFLLPAFFCTCAAGQTPSSIESPYEDLSLLRDGQILHRATGRLLTEKELVNYLGGYSVVYVGETHDSKNDHEVELKILKGLNEKFPGQIALGMEMLCRPSQTDVDAYINGELDDREFEKVWLDNWGNYNYYNKILMFARDNRIPIVALNAGKDLQKAVMEKGLDGLDEAMRKRLPVIDFNDPYYLEFCRAVFAAHTAGSNIAEVFNQVQSLWDETMAETAARFLQSGAGKDRKLMIMAGGDHVQYGFGIPRRLFRRLPLPYVIVSPYAVEISKEKQANIMDVKLPNLPMPPADVYWGVVYEGLDDDPVLLGVTCKKIDSGVGLLITGVMPGSPAEKGGLKKGDVILKMDGGAIKEVSDLKYQVGLHKPGEQGSIEIRRGNERLTVTVTYDPLKNGKTP
jgi:uncharacterized iron-regulated protein